MLLVVFPRQSRPEGPGSQHQQATVGDLPFSMPRCSSSLGECLDRKNSATGSLFRALPASSSKRLGLRCCRSSTKVEILLFQVSDFRELFSGIPLVLHDMRSLH